MKKIINMLFVAAALTAAVACSKDENVGRTFTSNNITVDSSSIAFTDAPSTGRVVVSSRNPISGISVSNDWCKATLQGNVVLVEVPQNLDFNSRVAMLTIKAGTDSVSLPVKQLGLATFAPEGEGTHEVGPRDTTLTFNYKHIEGIPVQSIVEPAARSWLSASVDNGKLTVTIKANQGNVERTGYVRLRSGIRPKTQEVRLNFTQDWDIDMQLTGTWTLSYFTQADTTGLTRQTQDCTFANDSIYIDYGSEGKLAFKFYKRLQHPYALLIRGSARCSGKVKDMTPYIYLSAEESKTWTGLQENSTVGGYLQRNAAGKLSAQLSGLLVNDPKQVFTSIAIVLFENAPATGFPANNDGRHKYTEYYYPIFTQK